MATSYVYYVVVKGDTLSRIASRFGTTVYAIMKLNPIIKDKSKISVGWKLKIPSTSGSSGGGSSGGGSSGGGSSGGDSGGGSSGGDSGGDSGSTEGQAPITTTLRQGDTGSEVLKVQVALMDLGYYTSTLDGIFGPLTTAAVWAFQAAHNLVVDGIVGPLTLRALFPGDASYYDSFWGPLDGGSTGGNTGGTPDISDPAGFIPSGAFPSNSTIPSSVPCYIRAIHMGTWCPLPAYPETVSDTATPNFEPQEVPGRSAPYFGYNNTGSREVSFSLTLHRDMLRANGLLKLPAFIQALAYPQYTSSAIVSPEVVVKLGREIYIRGVPQEASVERSGPIDKDGYFSKYEITVSVAEVVSSPYQASTIVTKGGYRN